jgi:hypothetical protein
VRGYGPPIVRCPSPDLLRKPTPPCGRGEEPNRRHADLSKSHPALERHLEPTGTIEVIAALMAKGARDVGGERHVGPNRSHDAGRDTAVDVLRCTVRDRPIVDDQGRRGRTELDNAAIADEIVFRRQVDIGVDDRPLTTNGARNCLPTLPISASSVYGPTARASTGSPASV